MGKTLNGTLNRMDIMSELIYIFAGTSNLLSLIFTMYVSTWPPNNVTFYQKPARCYNSLPQGS